MFSVNNFFRKAAAAGFVAAALTVPTISSTASAAPADKTPASAASQRPALTKAAKAFINNRRNKGICVRAHIQDIGWQQMSCGKSVFVGTVGQSKRIEALQFMPVRLGGLTAQGHVQDTGWGRTQRVRDNDWAFVGTVGQSKRLEAVRLDSRSDIWVQGHVQDIGWQRWDSNGRRGPAMAGTTGESKRLEALRVRVG